MSRALRVAVYLVLVTACRESRVWGLRAVAPGRRPGGLRCSRPADRRPPRDRVRMRSKPPSIGAARQPATQQQEACPQGQDVGKARISEPNSSPSRAVSQGVGLRDWAAGQVASLFISLAVLSIALLSPVVKDSEAAVARIIPTRLSHFLRDRWQSWSVFNRWTWALVAPGLAIARFDLLKVLLDTGNQQLNLPYGDGHASTRTGEVPPAARRELDVYHHGSSGAERPVVVFVHGGAWSHGSKELVSVLGKQLRDAGFVSVVVGYRRYPLAPTVWQSAEDVGAAMSYVTANIHRYGGDASRVILMGHSSGAHISAVHLLTSCATKEAVHGDAAGGDVGAKGDQGAAGRGEGGGVGGGEAGLAVGFIGISGVYDIPSHYLHEKRRGVHEISALKPANGFCMEAFSAASPTSLALALSKEGEAMKGRVPRMVRLVHCTDDTTVPFASSVDFCDALKTLAHGNADAHVHLQLLDKGGHGGPLMELILAKRNGVLSGGGEREREGVLLRLIDEILVGKRVRET
jgi:pimeloyl-ACP methyl ester carboxylesterase